MLNLLFGSGFSLSLSNVLLGLQPASGQLAPHSSPTVGTNTALITERDPRLFQDATNCSLSNRLAERLGHEGIAYLARRVETPSFVPYCAAQASTACSRAAPPKRASSPPISFSIISAALRPSPRPSPSQPSRQLAAAVRASVRACLPAACLRVLLPSAAMPDKSRTCQTRTSISTTCSRASTPSTKGWRASASSRSGRASTT